MSFRKSPFSYSTQSWRLTAKKWYLLPAAGILIMDAYCCQRLGNSELFEGRQWCDTNYELTNGEWPVATITPCLTNQRAGEWALTNERPDRRHSALTLRGDNDSSLTILALNQPNPHTASCFRKWLTKMSNNDLETRNSAAMLSASKVGYIITSPSQDWQIIHYKGIRSSLSVFQRMDNY